MGIMLNSSIASLSGTSIIGFNRSKQSGETFRAFNPASANEIEPVYWSASRDDLHRAVSLAESAAPVLSRMPGSHKAEFLRIIASKIENLGQALLTRVQDESGLPAARVKSETGRTCGQLRMFANVVEEGSWVDARIDYAEPDRKPVRKPDVRSMLRALGPVAVFGASNFPLAFSVAGGDTASAFAAGNPVIVKAHPAHPGTSELVGLAILDTVRECELPEGTFSMLFDSGYAIGCALVACPQIKAVGFTGSRAGGRALMEVIAQRPEPIPFYGEMSSVNPLFFLPGSLEGNCEAPIAGLFASLTNGAGQFCTKPGLIFVESEKAQMLTERLREKMEASPAFVMLTTGIAKAYRDDVKKRCEAIPVCLTGEMSALASSQAEGAIFRTDVASFLSDSSLTQEIFGPAAVLITYSTPNELIDVARRLEGQLTATVHGRPGELAAHQELLDILATRAGRLIFNGFPTGVEVNHAMVHGGPWPATSDSRSTSVGARAILRFARPVCYQDFPETALPDELKDVNPLGIARKVDGKFRT